MDESVKELQKQLTWEFPHIAKEAPDQTKEAAEYCEGYKAFLNKAKTEREFGPRTATRNMKSERSTRQAIRFTLSTGKRP